jgi:predicted RNA-binding protein with TRAM domain
MLNESVMKKEFVPEKPIEIGDEFTVDFIKNTRGGKPICRIRGMVCFLDNTVKDFVTPCSTWMVQVVAIHDTCMIVKPLYKVRTPKENEVILKEKLALLKPVKTEKHKEVKGHQYMSFAELKSEKEKM